MAAPGRLYAGTSGFAYPAWSPRFYPPGLGDRGLLDHYARHLPACELNNTFYRRPSEAGIAAWVAATPAGFRFAVKAQRGATVRALLADAAAASAWLTEPLPAFGERLGCVLFRVPEQIERDDGRLAALLTAWPPAVPLALEFQHPSWHVDEVFALVAGAGASLCATELPEDETPPAVRLTGPFLYVRLRRHGYRPEEIDAWAARLVPFLAAGHNAFVFFRHDETGGAPGLALALDEAVRVRIAREQGRA